MEPDWIRLPPARVAGRQARANQAARTGQWSPSRRLVHGSALPPSVRGGAVVADGQQLLHTAGGHAQQRGNPHPEYRTGAAQIDGCGHPGDAAGADGGGQGGAQGLEGGDPLTGRSWGRNREPRVADSHSRTRNRGKKPQPRDSSSPVRGERTPAARGPTGRRPHGREGTSISPPKPGPVRRTGPGGSVDMRREGKSERPGAGSTQTRTM